MERNLSGFGFGGRTNVEPYLVYITLFGIYMTHRFPGYDLEDERLIEGVARFAARCTPIVFSVWSEYSQGREREKRAA